MVLIEFYKKLFRNIYQEEIGPAILKWELTTDGVFTYLEGEEQPYRGLISSVLTDNCDFVKRTLMFVAKFPFLFPYYISIYRATLKKYEFKAEYYCRFVRALREAFINAYPAKVYAKKVGNGFVYTKIRPPLWFYDFFESLMMIFEVDNAYRFRIQDYLNTAGKNITFWNYWKTVGICKQRDHKVLRKKWNLLYLTLLFGWFIIKKILKKLDFDKIKWTIEDLYYIKDREDYNFLGLTKEMRNLLYENAKRLYQSVSSKNK